MGAARTAPELLHVLRHYGLFHSVCVPRWVKVMCIWSETWFQLLYLSLSLSLPHSTPALQLHWARSCVRLLDLAVCAQQAAGAGRYDIHCAAQAAADLPALVSSHHGADLLVVQLHGIHQLGALVHCDELLCAFGDVQLLCTEGGTLQSATFHLDDHYIAAVDPNDHWLCDQCVGQRVPEDAWHTIVQHIAAQH